MIIRTLAQHLPLLALTLAITFTTPVTASEVTGTLSSHSPGDSSITSGGIEGTVVSENTSADADDSGGGGGNRNRSSSGNSSRPPGVVLGESVTGPSIPNFPNAGMPVENQHTTQTLWSTVLWFVLSTLPY